MKAILLALSLLVSDHPPIDLNQVNCLAQAVYHESRGEPLAGQEAVAHVVLNRTQTLGFPNTPCKVVYQPYQFTNIRFTNPDKNSEAWKVAVNVALAAMLDRSDDPTKGAKYFYAQNVVRPQWAKGKQKIVIGNHTFL